MTKVVKLGGRERFQPADFSIQRFAATVPTGTTLKDVLHPEYFANHLDKMKPGMEITVVSDDFSLDARLRVLTVSKASAKLRVLDVFSGELAEGDEAQTVAPEDVRVSWGGPSHKFRIIHGTEIVDKGFASEEEAKEAATKYLEKVNA